MRKLAFFLICGLFLTPLQAAADDFGHDEVTLNFSRSMTNLYTASELCKNVNPQRNYGQYAVMIKAYLSALYEDNIPFWVLPVNPRDTSGLSCDTMMQRYIMAYKSASASYVQQHNPSSLPGFPSIIYEAQSQGSRDTLGLVRPQQR